MPLGSALQKQQKMLRRRRTQREGRRMWRRFVPHHPPCRSWQGIPWPDAPWLRHLLGRGGLRTPTPAPGHGSSSPEQRPCVKGSDHPGSHKSHQPHQLVPVCLCLGADPANVRKKGSRGWAAPAPLCTGTGSAPRHRLLLPNSPPCPPLRVFQHPWTSSPSHSLPSVIAVMTLHAKT